MCLDSLASPRLRRLASLIGMVVGLAAVFALCLATAAHAADRTWSNTGTDYNTGANWTGGLPGTGDAAVFSSAVTNQPNLSAPITNQQIRFTTLTGGWTLSGSSALTLTSTGTGATAGTGSAIVSANTSGTTTISAPIILGGAAATTATFTQTAGGTLAISGNISSTNAITGLSLAATGATGTFILSGNNTYSGTTTLGSNAALNINSATAIGAGTLVFGGSSTIDNTSAAAITLSNNNNINLSGGSLTFTGTKDLSFGSGTVTASVANRTITTTAGTLTIGNIDADTTARTFTKAGAGGTLVIQNAAGANFQGGFTLTSGGLQIGNNTALGTGGITFTAGTLQAINSDLTLANTSTLTALTISGTQSLTLNGKLTGATGANRTLTNNIAPGAGGKLLTLGNVDISNDTGVTARTLTIAGSGNTTITGTIANGTGTTTANGLIITNPGTTILSGANTFTGGLTAGAGRLVLDYANNATVVNSANALTLGAGTLEFKAKSTGTSAQTLGSVGYTANTGLSTVRVNENGGSGMAVTLGTVDTTVAGKSAVLFDLYNSANSTVKIGNTIANDTGTQGSIIMRTASGVYDFAVNGGNAANALSARNASATIGATNGSTTTDYFFTTTGSIGAGSPTTAIAIRSLRIAPTANNQTMTINNVGTYAGGGQAGMILAGGLIYDGGANDFTIAAATGSNGVSIRAGNNGSGFAIYQMGTGKLTIGDRVYLGFAGSSPGTGQSMPIGLFGTGLIDWQGSSNQINGSTSLNIYGTTVRISGTIDPVKLDTTATGKGSMNIVLNGGGVLEAVNSDITRNVGTGAGAIQWLGDGGFSAYGGNRAVNLAAGAQQTWGSSSFVPNGNALVLSSTYSDNSTIDFQNNIDFGTGQRVVRVNNGSAAVDAKLSGTLSSGLGGGLVKQGAGTLQLTANNTYTGATTIQAGTLDVTSFANGGSASGIGASGAGAANLVIDGGTLKYSGSTAASTDRSFTIGTSGATINASGTSSANTVTLTSTTAPTLLGTDTARTLILTGTNTGANTMAAPVGDNGSGKTTLVKNDVGTWVLTGTNTYTGNTTISGGNLQVGAGGTGSTAAGSAVSVNGASAVLSGTGTVGGDTTVTLGKISPGNTAGADEGTLTFGGALTFNPTSAAVVAALTIQGTSTSDETGDKIKVNGALTLNSNSFFTITQGASWTPADGQSWRLFDWASINPGSFSAGTNFRTGANDSIADGDGNLDLPDITTSGLVWDVSTFLSDGRISIVNLVPEPSRALLLLLGLVSALFRRRRPALFSA